LPLGLYQSVRIDPLADPTLLAKFKCHPTIPCSIPRNSEHLDALWHHVPDDLLPINWSCDWIWMNSWFLPAFEYNLEYRDILLKEVYGIQYPIKGVMYCIVDRVEPGGLFEEQLTFRNPECMVFEEIAYTR
jgi:hypothetical protein